LVAEAISPIGREEVFDAKMAEDGAASSKDYIFRNQSQIESHLEKRLLNG
jgi:hypothetical protein